MKKDRGKALNKAIIMLIFPHQSVFILKAPHLALPQRVASLCSNGFACDDIDLNIERHLICSPTFWLIVGASRQKGHIFFDDVFPYPRNQFDIDDVKVYWNKLVQRFKNLMKEKFAQSTFPPWTSDNESEAVACNT